MRPSPPQREQRWRTLPLPEQVPHFVVPEASQGTQAVAPLQFGQEWGAFGAGAEGSSAPTGTSEPKAITKAAATNLRNVFIVAATMKRTAWFGGYKFAEGFEGLSESASSERSRIPSISVMGRSRVARPPARMARGMSASEIIVLEKILHTSRSPQKFHPPRPSGIVCRSLAAQAKSGESP